MNPRFVYLLVVAIVAAFELSSGSVFHANRGSDSTGDSSYDSSEYSSDSSHRDRDFSDNEYSPGLNIELMFQARSLGPFGEANKKYERLFGSSKSKPVGPEEALKMLTELQNMYMGADKQDITGDAKLQVQWRSLNIKNLLALDAISRDCNLKGRGVSTWIWTVFDGNKREPGLQPYLSSIRERLFESCKPLFANNVNMYERKAANEHMLGKTSGGAATLLMESLARVPDEVVLRRKFLATASHQVSAALSEAYNFRYGGKSPRDKSQRYYKETFVDFVTQLCGRLLKVEILPGGLLGLALEQQDVGQLLDRRVINWLKVERICQQIQANPSAAADIVFNHNEYERDKKQAAKPAIGCLPRFGGNKPAARAQSNSKDSTN